MLTFAPSSAGKSFYASKASPTVLDGDDLIAGFIGWPDFDKWWEIPDVNDRQQKRSVALLVAIARLQPDVEIVVNVAPSYVDGNALRSARIPFRVVLPPFASILANAGRKAAEQRLGRHLGQPVDERTLRTNWEAWRTWASMYNVKTDSAF